MKMQQVILLIFAFCGFLPMGYAASEYFPSDINLNGLEEYYSDRLSAFREPSLPTLNETNRETYRFCGYVHSIMLW